MLNIMHHGVLWPENFVKNEADDHDGSGDQRCGTLGVIGTGHGAMDSDAEK